MILSSGAKYNQINFSKNHVSGNARKIGVTVIWWFTFGGAIYGYAANQKVLEHYMEKMKATHVGILHPYQFCVFEDEMQEIIKTYTYAYSGEEI